MAERTGWIRLHRSMLDHPLMEQLPAAWFRIWVAILLSANWKPGVWWNGKREISIPAGSFARAPSGSLRTMEATTYNCRIE